MPLLDHFHPPLCPRRARESFHSRWDNSIADQLNEALPDRYFAEVQLHLGTQVEADVAEFENVAKSQPEDTARGLAVQACAPPVATMTLPAVLPDDLEVLVRDELEDAPLAAVVELDSPRNKNRADSRWAFAAKRAAYLERGVGLVTVDVVTGRRANLHNDLIKLLGLDPWFAMAEEAILYAVAYRPVRRSESNQIDAWPVTPSVGGTLPTLPLALRGGAAVALNLETAYEDARARSRL
jgi:hypothetical protein